MNLYECEEFFKNLYQGKTVTLQFDSSCERSHELIYTDGKPNDVHHVEYRKVKVNVEGIPPVYVPINPHRECVKWEDMKARIASKG